MQPELVERLLRLNEEFYATFAKAFADTRSTPQPGFSKLLAYLPDPCRNVADIGCGNGRFGTFLNLNLPDFSYSGVDFTDSFLEMAGAALDGMFLRRDISRAGFLDGQGKFDLCVCLATLQHIPGKRNRLAVLQEMAKHLSENGRIFLSNWQFATSSRQRRKILDWQEVGLTPEDVEADDYLLSWQRNGRGIRYVHQLDQAEVSWLADGASLVLVDEYRSDGKEGDLNLYSILARR